MPAGNRFRGRKDRTEENQTIPYIPVYVFEVPILLGYECEGNRNEPDKKS